MVTDNHLFYVSHSVASAFHSPLCYIQLHWHGFVVAQWTGEFEPGVGTVNIYKAGDSTPILTVEDIPLTPGPIDVVLKCPVVPIGMQPSDVHCWPPENNKRDQAIGMYVEAVAASYHTNPVDNTAFVRMMNLSPNAHGAGLRYNSKNLFNATLEEGDSSAWWSLPTVSTKFEATAFDAKGDEIIATITMTPPASPASMTMWLLGQMQDPKFPPTLLPLIDAPPPQAGVGTFCS